MDKDMMQVIREFGLDVEDTDIQTIREREREYIKRSLAKCDEVIAKINETLKTRGVTP